MLAQIGDFVGQYTLTWAEGVDGLLQANQQLFIGTGTHGDPEPTLTENYSVVVGVTFWDAVAERRVLEPNSDDPFLFLYDAGQLLRLQLVKTDTPFRMQISLSKVQSVSGMMSKYAYGIALIGDPEEVGVWGANGNPPGSPKIVPG